MTSASLVTCLLRADCHNGGEPVEATVELAVLPRKGDMIEAWDPDGVWRYLNVEMVVLCARAVGAPPRGVDAEVWVRLDGYDVEALRRVVIASGCFGALPVPVSKNH